MMIVLTHIAAFSGNFRDKLLITGEFINNLKEGKNEMVEYQGFI
jgi:hypothetical protein